MPNTILTEISKLNDFVRDLCFENGHEASMFEHLDGETLYDATVNILASTGETVVTGVLLRDAIVVYLQTHLAVLISASMQNEDADRIYEMLSRHFFAMGINEFYVPLALFKHNPKSQFTQYTIGVVPNNIWGKHIATEMAKLVKGGKFEVAMPANVNMFSDSASAVYGYYVDIIACCLINKTVRQTSGIKISD